MLWAEVVWLLVCMLWSAKPDHPAKDELTIPIRLSILSIVGRCGVQGEVDARMRHGGISGLAGGGRLLEGFRAGWLREPRKHGTGVRVACCAVLAGTPFQLFAGAQPMQPIHCQWFCVFEKDACATAQRRGRAPNDRLGRRPESAGQPCLP
ncbi:hypothetical protein N658DRAFT_75626 [Parathielavia hyrcaniae]|uniref:Secreted protein n=1 Tax=Parathielavia hyrcaniae TaxID=113614 RepID=A0AAN6Q3B3_9PEZI|nr:hypothetical protein N658DRAFT_75626 [Parathielavia hyrcaniae]